MTGNPAAEAQDWAEANILPASPELPEVLLLDVVDPLIHEVFKERIESWHYFWEHDPIKTLHLRLRLLWRPGAEREGSAVLARYLDEAEASGRLSSWYLGNHGVRGEQYEGEAAAYDGPEMWHVTYEDWHAGSDLALGLLRLEAQGRLAEGRKRHVERRVHLHSNRLGMNYLDEGSLYLGLAIGYLAHAGIGTTPLGAEALATLSQINDAVAAAVEQNKAN
ncbi:MAG TPA: lantibiotic dehydratase C-terminal domain-containing protein [Streptosporangiaceae bacterium]|nr:lantibiotic dehydratase C-terminal domain-containing protein [Streptosporangiaceae bacterium]